jgi:type I restriction enzyme S subunit
MELVEEKAKFQRYAAYKDSGVEWLGKIPADWFGTRVKNVFRLVIEPAPKNNNYELLSVYTGIGVKPRRELEERGNKASTTDGYWLVQKGDVVVNKLLAWMGAIGVSEYDGVTSPAYDILRARKTINSTYFHYLFRNPNCLAELKKHSRGIMDMRLRLYFDKFGDIIIPFPSYETQNKIVCFLNDKTAKIDKAIALKEKLIALLKERKQIMIQNAVTKGLDPNVKMKDSGVDWIGEIPEHWEVKNLRYAFKFLNHRRIPLSAIERETMQGEYPYYGASGIIDYVDNYIFNEKTILIAEDGANLLSKSTPLAFVAEGKYWVNNHAHILQPKFEGFLYWAELLSLIDYTVFISGAAQPKLSRDSLGGVKVIVPPKSEIEQLVKLIRKVNNKFSRTFKLQSTQINKLKEYKATLIDSAVTGKIKVPGV